MANRRPVRPRQPSQRPRSLRRTSREGRAPAAKLTLGRPIHTLAPDPQDRWLCVVAIQVAAYPKAPGCNRGLSSFWRSLTLPAFSADPMVRPPRGCVPCLWPPGIDTCPHRADLRKQLRRPVATVGAGVRCRHVSTGSSWRPRRQLVLDVGGPALELLRLGPRRPTWSVGVRAQPEPFRQG